MQGIGYCILTFQHEDLETRHSRYRSQRRLRLGRCRRLPLHFGGDKDQLGDKQNCDRFSKWQNVEVGPLGIIALEPGWPAVAGCHRICRRING